MKRNLFVNVIALLSLFFLLPYSASPAAEAVKSPVITTEWSFPTQVGYDYVAPKAVIPKPAGFMLIDSRPYEGRYIHGYIPTAVSLPDSAFAKKAAEILPADKNVELVFYCQGVDCTLSHQSAFKAQKAGYKKVSVYTGGLPDWLAHGAIPAVRVEHVKQAMEKGDVYILIDSRPAEKFVQGSVPTAVSIPDSRFAQRAGMLPADKKVPLFFFCGGCDCVLSHQSARKARELGYSDIAVVEAGYPAWTALYGSGAAVGKKDDGERQGMYPVIDFEKALASGKPSFVVIDMRSAAEYKAGHIPGSINIAADALEGKLADLPRDRDVIFICSTGSRAGEAYYAAKDKYPQAKNFHYLEAAIKFNNDGTYQISPNP
ncbi:MAG: sulfurtransferase [Desulfovibrio sp.]|jgi:rhodanese-related sulfurtransferase|nr:sulfurtransferase [Desulfovibrio sp.]